jgi:hypothetical protein
MLAIAVLAVLGAASARAADTVYDCASKTGPNGKYTISGTQEYFETSNNSKSELAGLAPEDYPIAVKKNHSLSELTKWENGNNDTYYADTPDNTLKKPSEFSFTVIEYSDQDRRPLFTDYRCVKSMFMGF